MQEKRLNLVKKNENTNYKSSAGGMLLKRKKNTQKKCKKETYFLSIFEKISEDK